MNQPVSVDLLLDGGMILTMDSDRRVIPEGVVAVQGARIAWVGSKAEAEGLFLASQRVDTTGKVVMPGLVNTHGHWAMTLFRGLVDDRPLEEWLKTIWRVEAAFTSPANVAAGARLAMVEMLHSGTTCAADMYWQFPYTTEAARQAGFRALNGPSFAELTGYGGKRGTEYAGAIEYLDRYRDDPLIHPCIQMHATYTTNRAMMEDARRLAEERGLIFVTHAAESKGEMAMVREKYGQTPIEVIDQAGLLGPRTLLAHCVHLSDAEIARLAETGTSVAHCPSSNLKLASGIARVAEMLAAGVNVTIGTDGPASNNDLDLFHEAQLAAMVQKGVSGDPTVLPAEQVVAMMTVGGARALGLGDRLGSLETGKLADMAVIDLASPAMTPCYDIYSQLVYAAGPGDVSDVVINGRVVMREREILTLDEEGVKADVRQIAKEVRLV